MNSGGVPIITGFQGINHQNRLTTLERGGSDASAIMIAKFFKAEKCIIYTDVEGVYTTDPNYTKKAKKIKNILRRNARNVIFRSQSYATRFNTRCKIKQS